MVSRDDNVTNLQQLLDSIEDASQRGDRISLSAVLETMGERSFGPMLVLAGVVVLAPLIGDIPGIPTTVGIIVFLVAGQLLLGRKHFWLPRWLLERSVASDKARKALGWLRPPARVIDRLLAPRLTMFTRGAATYAVAVACLVIAMTMPAMEVVLFAANVAGAALCAFGLALIARDGLMALIAFAFTATTIGVGMYNLLPLG